MCEWKRFPTIIIDLDMGLARGVDFGPVAAGGVRVTICTPGLSSGAGIGESCNCPVGTGFVIFIRFVSKGFGFGLALEGVRQERVRYFLYMLIWVNAGC